MQTTVKEPNAPAVITLTAKEVESLVKYISVHPYESLEITQLHSSGIGRSTILRNPNDTNFEWDITEIDSW